MKKVMVIMFSLAAIIGIAMPVTAIIWVNIVNNPARLIAEQTKPLAQNGLHMTNDGIRTEIARVEKEAMEQKAREEQEAREAAAREEAERQEAERKAAEAELARQAAAARPIFTSLQEAVNYWLSNYQHGTVGIEIFDLRQNTIMASYNSTAAMRPRSLYKLFYAYDGYAQIDAGLENADAPFLGENSLGYCLDIMIRRSDNPCAEAMLSDPVRLARVSSLIQNLGLSSTQSDGLLTSAHDISLLLQHYYRHPDWSGATWQKFLETALNQPYNYRKGLPSGFSTAVVYNKTGWGGINYNDAAIVDFPNLGACYVVVILTDNTSYANIAALGTLIEETVINMYR